MKNTFVVDFDTKECVGIINFIPRREERVVLSEKEYKVMCVVYDPKERSVLVFVNMVDNYYSALFKDIKWNL